MSSAANKDAALACASLAREAMSASPPDAQRAARLAEKAARLYSCPETTAVLLQAQALAAEAEARAHRQAAGAGAGGGSSGGAAAAANGVRHRAAAAANNAAAAGRTPSTSSSAATATAAPSGSSSQPAATQEQITLVSTILRAKTHYEVLSVPRSPPADDEAIKRAYRRLALRLHPDKCRAPRAEEAFKAVSRAFSVLSDPDKRAYYDRTGHDSAASAQAASAQAAADAAAARAGIASLAQLLPLLLVVFLTLFSSRPEPAYVLSPGGDGRGGAGAYREAMVTHRLEVPFYVKSAAEFARRYPDGSRARQRVDREIEGDHYDRTHVRCQHELLQRQRLAAWGGRAARERAAAMATPFCDELAGLNARLGARQHGY